MIEKTLDPENWEDMRTLGHRMMDDVMDYLQNIRSQPVWKPFPTQSKEFLTENIPDEPMPAEAVYAEFKEHIFPYTKGNIHPRFWAWVQGTGTPMGVMADMLASAMNPNVTIGEQSALYVDQQIINWCKEIMGFPVNASGMLLSGASMANTTALTVARNTMLPDVRYNGMQSETKKPIIYISTETHSCVIKSAEVIGIGSNNIRKIPVDDQYKIKLDKLEMQILDDLSEGFNPFCVVANAGTVNTGAIDDLNGISHICKKYKLWFHIDGAFGALAKLSAEYGEELKPIEVADSVAFDLHKWMYMPYEVACVLVRNYSAHREAFSIQPSYLLNHERGLAAGPDSLNNFGIELSRGFKALKVWMSIKEHGLKKYTEQIEKNIQQARYLVSLVEMHENLELLAPVPLNIVCFRYNSGNLSDEKLNQINKEIVMNLQEQGIASPSSTILAGKYAIRAAITNHRSLTADFDTFVGEVLRLGQELQEIQID